MPRNRTPTSNAWTTNSQTMFRMPTPNRAPRSAFPAGAQEIAVAPEDLDPLGRNAEPIGDYDRITDNAYYPEEARKAQELIRAKQRA